MNTLQSNPICSCCKCYWKPDETDIKTSGLYYKTCKRCRDRNLKKITCECGSVYSYSQEASHFRTKKHLQIMKAIEEYSKDWKEILDKKQREEKENKQSETRKNYYQKNKEKIDKQNMDYGKKRMIETTKKKTEITKEELEKLNEVGSLFD